MYGPIPSPGFIKFGATGPSLFAPNHLSPKSCMGYTSSLKNIPFRIFLKC